MLISRHRAAIRVGVRVLRERRRNLDERIEEVERLRGRGSYTALRASSPTFGETRYCGLETFVEAYALLHELPVVRLAQAERRRAKARSFVQHWEHPFCGRGAHAGAR
jgi:hypothetical protein